MADLVAFGAVYLCENGATGKLRKLREDVEVAQGDVMRVHVHPRRFPAARRDDWAQRVVRPAVGAPPAGIVVVDKPSGVPCGPATLDNAVETAAMQLTRALGGSADGAFVAGSADDAGDGCEAFATLEPVGRLDVCTSGLLVLAADAASARAGNDRLVAGGVDKRYACRVVLSEGHERPPQLGLLEHWVLTGWQGGKTRVLPDVRSADDAQRLGIAGAKRCALEVLSVSPARGAPPGRFDIELRLLTGRTHQNRAQMAAAGAPLLGDAVYARATAEAIAAAERSGGDAEVRALYPSGRAPDAIALRCASLAWEGVRYEAPPTREWDDLEGAADEGAKRARTVPRSC